MIFLSVNNAFEQGKDVNSLRKPSCELERNKAWELQLLKNKAVKVATVGCANSHSIANSQNFIENVIWQNQKTDDLATRVHRKKKY